MQACAVLIYAVYRVCGVSLPSQMIRGLLDYSYDFAFPQQRIFFRCYLLLFEYSTGDIVFSSAFLRLE